MLAAPYLSVGDSDEESKQIKEGGRRVREAISPKKSDVSCLCILPKIECKLSHTVVQPVIGGRGCLEIECATCSRKLQL